MSKRSKLHFLETVNPAYSAPAYTKTPECTVRLGSGHRETGCRLRISPILFLLLPFATDALSESNLIGSGSFGSVYKGVLRSGTAIAVKVFNQQLDASFRSLETECEVLRSLRQRNLVKVITSCSNLDFKALVLEYMPNGSLERYLYSHNYFLDIMQRLRIMIDVACALEYLHHGCSLSVIHCDLKPRNVLLDEDMVAHLSDFGISKMLGDDKCDLYTKTLSTLGYIAPEYGLDGLVSTKCDVYSYGIMLLETFTRELEVVASIKKLALDCCAESLARRTNMKNVVGMLQKTKIKLLECGECSSK
ncbi:receptor kinase-like protein Xa21 [Capsicum annuum]|uniref:receptor kinase-like protein Xa21 n=1 Tax=Capsicum annuum TaxID=4072 RepID=UPI001FB11648|nr:receptor kinase-like protein Xa21 [Capsicum annuum]